MGRVRGAAIGAVHWASLLIRGERCFVCQRRYAAHKPWELYLCNRTPVPIVIGYEGEQEVA
jgi:hypothetical protein